MSSDGFAGYENAAPEHSYINAADFASPKDLADYLKHLGENDEEYLSYFWWTNTHDWEDVSFFSRLYAQLRHPYIANFVFRRLTRTISADCATNSTRLRTKAR